MNLNEKQITTLNNLFAGIKQELRLRDSEDESLKKAAADAGTVRREAMKSIMASQDTMMQAEINVSGVSLPLLEG